MDVIIFKESTLQSKMGEAFRIELDNDFTVYRCLCLNYVEKLYLLKSRKPHVNRNITK